jgi:predicted RecA/RadA family phage recombinase
LNNYDSPGEVVTLTTPSGGVVSGTGKLIGSLFVIPTVTITAAQVTADPTIKFAGLVIGVVEMAKTSAQAWTEGVKVYWITATSLVTTSAGGNTLIGVAARAAANPSATGFVRLDGMAR